MNVISDDVEKTEKITILMVKNYINYRNIYLKVVNYCKCLVNLFQGVVKINLSVKSHNEFNCARKSKKN